MVKFSTGRGSRVRHSTGREWEDLEKVRTPWIPRTVRDAWREQRGTETTGFPAERLGTEKVKATPFRKMVPRGKGQVVEEVRKPVIDVFEEEDHVLVVAELPDVEEKEAAYEVKNGILTISSHGGRKYREEVLLPCTIDAGDMKAAWRNGILELRLKRMELVGRTDK